MSSQTLNTFLTSNYSEIIVMASKICKGHRDHEEVAHYAISEFIEHDRAEELVYQGKAMQLLSGMIHRSFHSSTSRYHKIYRQAGRVYPYDTLFRYVTSGQEKTGEIFDSGIGWRGNDWLRAYKFDILYTT